MVVHPRQPETIDNPLTAILERGAHRLLARATEAEADAFLAQMKDVPLPDGRDRMVRHGHGPKRLVQTGTGPLPARRVKLRDRSPAEADGRIWLSSAILPRWARRTPSLDALLPILPLRGVQRCTVHKTADVLNRMPNSVQPVVKVDLRGIRTVPIVPRPRRRSRPVPRSMEPDAKRRPPAWPRTVTGC